ncbi:hypothetical protein ACHAWO_012550 [Cyclotella atomus]|uniref:LAGLIDADG homing endonuclease n=1 Tax=Cyclotella atomus TaxID=382360 RepID=A0ABD3NST2_9STRA
MYQFELLVGVGISRIIDADPAADITTLLQTLGFMADIPNVFFTNTKTHTYALKHLRPNRTQKYKPNPFALSSTGFEQGPKGYFLVIDRLNKTLSQRIAKWKKSTKRLSLNFLQSIKSRGRVGAADSPLSKQLEVLLKLATARTTSFTEMPSHKTNAKVNYHDVHFASSISFSLFQHTHCVIAKSYHCTGSWRQRYSVRSREGKISRPMSTYSFSGK